MAPRGGRPPRVAVDALGGDLGPRVVVEGAVAACREFNLQVVLVGPQGVVAEELRRAGAGDAPTTISRRPG